VFKLNFNEEAVVVAFAVVIATTAFSLLKLCR
jgi:hypothetical protein